jgi:hypothetical protein
MWQVKNTPCSITWIQEVRIEQMPRLKGIRTNDSFKIGCYGDLNL